MISVHHSMVYVADPKHAARSGDVLPLVRVSSGVQLSQGEVEEHQVQPLALLL